MVRSPWSVASGCGPRRIGGPTDSCAGAGLAKASWARNAVSATAAARRVALFEEALIGDDLFDASGVRRQVEGRQECESGGDAQNQQQCEDQPESSHGVS